MYASSIFDKMSSQHVKLAFVSTLAIIGIVLPVRADANTVAYRVKKGDVFYGIARREHITRDTLQRLNPDITPENLAIGQVIQLPSRQITTRPTRHRVRHTPLQSQPASAVRAAVPTVPIARKVAAPKTTVKAAKPEPRTIVPKPEPVKRAAYPKPPEPAGNMPSTDGIVLGLLWKLGLTLGLSILAFQILKWMMNRPATLRAINERLEVLESATLGSKRYLHLVRVGEKVLVLGSTPGEITIIGQLSKAEGVSEAATASRHSFSSRLAEVLAEEERGMNLQPGIPV